MPPIPDRLSRLLAFHENAAAAIRATIALLQSHPDRAASNGHSPTMHAALALDKQRRAAPRRTAPVNIKEQRQRTAETLSHFDVKEPKLPGELPSKPQGLGAMIARGYLKRKGPGYIRTAKPFVV